MMTGTDSSPQNVTGTEIFFRYPAAPPLADGVTSAKHPFTAPCKRLFAVTYEFRTSIFLCVLRDYTLFIQKSQGGYLFLFISILKKAKTEPSKGSVLL
jgi:hypothetical protein